MLIKSKSDLEQAAVSFGLLPFFPNGIRGFSVEELTTPALLFGGNEYEGCWEWKGPVVRRRTTAYGKFFRKKAGFVSLELLPHFLNWRRSTLPIKPESTDEMIYDIISLNDKMTSTDLRESILGKPKRRTAFDLPDLEASVPAPFAGLDEKKPSRHSLEGPLQRLQMGGWLCISDFRYKQTRRGERYGWGVAEYSTPESLFGSRELTVDASPEESLEFILDFMAGRLRNASRAQLLTLLKP